MNTVITILFGLIGIAFHLATLFYLMDHNIAYALDGGMAGLCAYLLCAVHHYAYPE